MTRISELEIRVMGRVPEPVAKVFVMNEVTEQIAGQFIEDGSYSFQIAAANGDLMSLWYTVAGELSEPIEFRVPALTVSVPERPSSE